MPSHADSLPVVLGDTLGRYATCLSGRAPRKGGGPAETASRFCQEFLDFAIIE